jgi:putative endonuclease
MSSAARSWYVYLVECRDGTLYTGVACDVERRVEEHNSGRGARYTRGRAPVRVVAASRAMEKRAAYRLEWAVKRLPRAEKEAAVQAARRGGRRRPARGARGLATSRSRG